LSSDSELLLRYLDHDLSVAEAADFRARLAESPALRRELAEMRRVGALVRLWAEDAERRAEPLVESTLRRVEDSARRRARYASLAYVLVAVMLVALPWSRHGEVHEVKTVPAAAAIERVETTDQQARVFVGSSGTPVVWLADDAQEDEADEHEQDPG